MHPRRVAASLAVGLFVAVVAAVWVSASLDPFIWPSALVGVPTGLVVGAATAALAYRRLDGDHPDTPTGLAP
jgi:hypothetical protein